MCIRDSPSPLSLDLKVGKESEGVMEADASKSTTVTEVSTPGSGATTVIGDNDNPFTPSPAKVHQNFNLDMPPYGAATVLLLAKDPEKRGNVGNVNVIVSKAEARRQELLRQKPCNCSGGKIKMKESDQRYQDNNWLVKTYGQSAFPGEPPTDVLSSDEEFVGEVEAGKYV